MGLIFLVTQPEELLAFATDHETNVLKHSFTCVHTLEFRGGRVFTMASNNADDMILLFGFLPGYSWMGRRVYVCKASHPILCCPLAVAYPMSINKRLTQEANFQFVAGLKFVRMKLDWV